MPVVAGLWPFDSALNAEFMANEVPDVRRARGARRADACSRRAPTRPGGEGARIAAELLAALRPMTAGVVVSTPAGAASNAALAVLDGSADASTDIAGRVRVTVLV